MRRFIRPVVRLTSRCLDSMLLPKASTVFKPKIHLCIVNTTQLQVLRLKYIYGDVFGLTEPVFSPII